MPEPRPGGWQYRNQNPRPDHQDVSAPIEMRPPEIRRMDQLGHKRRPPWPHREHWHRVPAVRDHKIAAVHGSGGGLQSPRLLIRFDGEQPRFETNWHPVIRSESLEVFDDVVTMRVAP